MNEEKHYTLRELTKFLPLHIDTLRRYCREGKIKPIVIIGNRILISESTLRQFLESHTFNEPER